MKTFWLWYLLFNENFVNMFLIVVSIHICIDDLYLYGVIKQEGNEFSYFVVILSKVNTNSVFKYKKVLVLLIT